MKDLDETGAVDDAVEPTRAWAEYFAATSLPAADAADLVAGALKASRVVARAAEQLTWLTQDTFVDAMRRMEQLDVQ
ncbi:hypothetical protein [Castellaniella sp.]|uniref:hypothetical protein n=1 Tax=Castellaniella sp. TaxID=1955812 RepID=UPI003A8F72D0